MSPPVMAGWNLALRFGLELAALAGVGVAAWQLASGPWRWIAVVAVPLAAAVVWGTFNVPDDPSRSGRAPVQVAGGVRLVLEVAVLGLGSLGLLASGPRAVGLAMVLLVVVHYAASMPRIRWLLDR